MAWQIGENPTDLIIYQLKAPEMFRKGTFRKIKLKGLNIITAQLKKEFVRTAQNPKANIVQQYEFDPMVWNEDSARLWIKENVEDRYKHELEKRYLTVKDVIGVGIIQVLDESMIFMPSPYKDIIVWNTLELAIEFRKGEIRFGNIPLMAAYGHIRKHLGADRMTLDCYVGDNLSSSEIYQITQVKPDGSFDEYKFMIGFDSMHQAQTVYLQCMPAELFGGIRQSSLEEIRWHRTNKLVDNLDSVEEISVERVNDTEKLATLERTEKTLEDLKDCLRSVMLPDDTTIETLTDEVIQLLTDGRIRAKILVTQADIENLNARQYTKESLKSAVDDAQEAVRLGLLIGYEEHPEPLFNQDREPIGYNYIQNPPLFRIVKLWYDQGQVWALAEFFDTPKGKEYTQKIKKGQRVSVSLRALGECEEVNGDKICSIERIDGFDVVPNPALPSARVIDYSEIADSVKRTENVENIENIEERINEVINIDKIITDEKNSEESKELKQATQVSKKDGQDKKDWTKLKPLFDAMAKMSKTSRVTKTSEADKKNSAATKSENKISLEKKSLEKKNLADGAYSPYPRTTRTVNKECHKDMCKCAVKGSCTSGLTPQSSHTSSAKNKSLIGDSMEELLKLFEEMGEEVPPMWKVALKAFELGKNSSMGGSEMPSMAEEAAEGEAPISIPEDTPSEEAPLEEAKASGGMPPWLQKDKPAESAPAESGNMNTKEAPAEGGTGEMKSKEEEEMKMDQVQSDQTTSDESETAEEPVIPETASAETDAAQSDAGSKCDSGVPNADTTDNVSSVDSVDNVDGTETSGKHVGPPAPGVELASSTTTDENVTDMKGNPPPDYLKDLNSVSDAKLWEAGTGAVEVAPGQEHEPMTPPPAAENKMVKPLTIPNKNQPMTIKAPTSQSMAKEETAVMSAKIPNKPLKEVEKLTAMDNKALIDELLKAVKADKGNDSGVSPDMLSRIQKMIDRDAATERKQAVTDAVNQAIIDGKVDDVDLTNISTAQVSQLAKQITDSCETPEAALQALRFGAKVLTDAALLERKDVIINNIPNAPRGKSVEVIKDDKSWMTYVDKLEKSIESNRKRYRPRDVNLVADYGRVNQSFADTVVSDWESVHVKDFVDFSRAQNRALRDNVISDSALVISNSDFKNQPIIARVLIRQIFQRLMALQLVQGLGPGSAIGSPGPGGGPFGAEFKIPILSYNPPTHNAKRHVGPTSPIPQSSSNLRFESFYARMRALGFAISDELRDQMINGAIGLDPVAIMIDDISQDMARAIDTHILEEHQQTCDEFGAVAVTNETPVTGDTVYNAGGSAAITYDGGTVTYASTVLTVIKALSGSTGGRPIVLPRTETALDAAGTTGSTVTNAISVTLSSVALNRGILTSTGAIDKIDPNDAAPDYAVDFERGYFVFNAASTVTNLNLANVRLNYSYATNYVSFDLDPTSGVPAEDYYDSLINHIIQTAAVMDSAPRYRFPDVCLFPSSVGLGAVSIASLFHKRKSPVDVAMQSGYAKSDVLGEVAGITMMRTNAELFAGTRRALLFQRYMVGYGVQSPAQIKGPINNLYAPNGGGIVQMTPGEQWALQVRDVVGTPLPRNGSLTVINHPGISIRFSGNVTN